MFNTSTFPPLPFIGQPSGLLRLQRHSCLPCGQPPKFLHLLCHWCFPCGQPPDLLHLCHLRCLPCARPPDCLHLRRCRSLAFCCSSPATEEPSATSGATKWLLSWIDKPESPWRCVAWPTENPSPWREPEATRRAKGRSSWGRGPQAICYQSCMAANGLQAGDHRCSTAGSSNCLCKRS